MSRRGISINYFSQIDQNFAKIINKLNYTRNYIHPSKRLEKFIDIMHHKRMKLVLSPCCDKGAPWQQNHDIHLILTNNAEYQITRISKNVSLTESASALDRENFAIEFTTDFIYGGRMVLSHINIKLPGRSYSLVDMPKKLTSFCVYFMQQW